MIFKLIKNKHGETIVESIIALTILAIGITFSSSIMSSSLRNINTAKNRVIAVNISREGIEAMRNIRDTNWLKFSSNRRTCWNHKPKTLASDTCTDSNNSIIPDEYIIYQDENHRWRLDTTTKTQANDKIPLSLVDINPSVNSDQKGGADDDADIYNHIGITDDSGGTADNDALGRSYAQSTIFKRIIKIEYITNNGCTIDNITKFNNPSSSSCTNSATTNQLNRIRVTSTVTWREVSNEYKVTLKTHLNDYLGRENFDN